MWLRQLIVFFAAGNTPFALGWALVYPYCMSRVHTAFSIWAAAVGVYVMNSVFLEVFPAEELQPSRKTLSLSKVVPVVAANLFSCLVLTRVNVSDRLVTDWQFLCYILIAFAGNEIIYAPVHKLLHHPVLYKYHKDHHAQVKPRATGAVYCSLVEMWLANIPSFVLPLYIFDAPACVYFAWIVSGIQTSQLHHSGKSYWWTAWSAQPQFHDDHHRLFNVNFGNIGVFESLLRS